MLTQHIALVPEANGVSAADLARVSAALQKQVLRDVGPFWNVSASVDAFPSLEDVPVGYWPIIVTFRALGRQAGVQLDRNGQPFAQVELSPSWSLFASRACLEMLVNPYGNRTVTTTSPRADQGPVEVLVEVCGPCADARYAYTVNDLLVSDFCTPAYFGAASLSTSPRYTFSGAVTAAFQVAPGGHLAWYDAVSDSWWLRNHWDATPAELKLGSIERQVVSARELAFERMPARLTSGASVEALETLVGVSRQHALQASQFRAHRMRALLPSSSSMPPQQPQQPQWHATFAAAQVLSRETQRKRADRHFDLLVEMLHEDPEQLEIDADAEPELEEDASSSMQLEAALEQEHAQLDAGSRTLPPPLPAAATSIAPARRSSAPPATPAAAYSASRAGERRSVAPTMSTPAVPEAQPAPRNAPSTAPVAPSDTTHAAHTVHATALRAQPLAAPRIEPLPRTRATSTRASESSTPWLLGAVAAVVLLGLGWASRGLLAPSSATTSATSTPNAALTTTVSAATEAAPQPSVAATAPAAAAPATQPAVQPPVVAATAAPTAAVRAATASAQPVPPTLPVPPSAAAGTATASTAAAAGPATPADLVASRSRHTRRRSDLPETEAPAATPNTAPVQAPSIDDLLNSRR